MRGQIVFLDRDGVINRKIEDGYVTRWSEFQFLPGAKEAIRRLKEAGCRVYVVSNQAGVNRGRMTAEDLDEITGRMLSEIRGAGGEIHDVACCPHRPDEGCGCRKPQTGLITGLAEKHGLDLSSENGVLVGDSPADMEAARRAGLWPILVRDGAEPADVGECAAAGSLLEAVFRILRQTPDGTAQVGNQAIP